MSNRFVDTDTGYYDNLKKEMDRKYEESVDAQFSRTETPEGEKKREQDVLRAPLGRAIVKVETRDTLRKIGSVWLVDSSLTDVGPRVLIGSVQDVHPLQIEIGYHTRRHDFKAGQIVLIDRKAAKRLIRGAQPGMIVSVWTNYLIAVAG